MKGASADWIAPRRGRNSARLSRSPSATKTGGAFGAPGVHPGLAYEGGRDTRHGGRYIHVIHVYISGRPRAPCQGDGLAQRGGDSPSTIDFVRHPQLSTHVKAVEVSRLRYARATSRRVTRAPLPRPLRIPLQSCPRPILSRERERNFAGCYLFGGFQVPAFRTAVPRRFVPRRLGDITNVAPRRTSCFPFFPFRFFVLDVIAE